jgi:hypothetical protein
MDTGFQSGQKGIVPLEHGFYYLLRIIERYYNIQFTAEDGGWITVDGKEYQVHYVDEMQLSNSLKYLLEVQRGKPSKKINLCFLNVEIIRGNASDRKHSLRENVSRETFCASSGRVWGKAPIKPPVPLSPRYTKIIICKGEIKWATSIGPCVRAPVRRWWKTRIRCAAKSPRTGPPLRNLPAVAPVGGKRRAALRS